DRVIPIIPQFNFIMAWNRGISFSLFSAGSDAQTWLLVGVQSAITLGLLWWLARLNGRLLIVGAGLIIGGAIGNIIDRLRFGAVTDFIDFYVGNWHFATFNVADSCISIGVGLWLLDAVIRKPHHDATANG
ncbi:MAG: signal peptidase II, partial [Rhodobacteraceae bacterium]|nr:signal peptidase II [Paracoccaceae bacterium]